MTEQRSGVAAPAHPGVFIEDEMRARGLNGSELARALGVSAQQVCDLRRGRRGISPAMAIRLSQWTGSSARLWQRLQADYDLWLMELRDGDRIRSEVTPGAWPAQEHQ